MLDFMLGSNRSCDRVTRRDLIRVGSLATGITKGLGRNQIEQDPDLERLTGDSGYRQLLTKQGAK